MADTTEKTIGKGWRYLPIAIIAGVAVAGIWLFSDRLSFETLAQHHAALTAFRDSHYAISVIVFVAVYAAMVAFSLPGATVATLTGGFLFDLFPGTLINVAAATLGATGIFLAARLGFGDALAHRLDRAGDRTRRLAQALKDNELSVLFMMRLVPVVPFFVANLLPAFAGIRLRRFVVTTFLGIIPGALVYTWLGAGLGAVFARGGTPDLGIIFEPYILGPMLGLAALAGLPILLRGWRNRSRQ